MKLRCTGAVGMPTGAGMSCRVVIASLLLELFGAQTHRNLLLPLRLLIYSTPTTSMPSWKANWWLLCWRAGRATGRGWRSRWATHKRWAAAGKLVEEKWNGGRAGLEQQMGDAQKVGGWCSRYSLRDQHASIDAHCCTLGDAPGWRQLVPSAAWHPCQRALIACACTSGLGSVYLLNFLPS